LKPFKCKYHNDDQERITDVFSHFPLKSFCVLWFDYNGIFHCPNFIRVSTQGDTNRNPESSKNLSNAAIFFPLIFSSSILKENWSMLWEWYLDSADKIRINPCHLFYPKKKRLQ
jgi:hypothetical protein